MHLMFLNIGWDMDGVSRASCCGSVVLCRHSDLPGRTACMDYQARLP